VDADAFAVPDPYYSGEEGFELVLNLIEPACINLLERLDLNKTLTAETTQVEQKIEPSHGN
jgi:hypothetical protein